MTEQRPDILENECKDIDFFELNLYGIILGDINVNPEQGEKYLFQSNPSPSGKFGASDLWRGYISKYRFTFEGQLILVGYLYPYEKNRKPDEVYEVLKDDFWLVMKKIFFSKPVYIPFKDGKIIKDKTKWICEDSYSLAHTGNFQKALELANALKDRFGKLMALKEIFEAFEKGGKKEEANKLLNEILELVSLVEDDFEKISAVRDIIRSLIKIGNFQKATEIANMIENTFLKSEILIETGNMFIHYGKREIGSTLIKQGEKEKAIQIFQKAIETMKGSNDQEKITILLSVAESLDKIEEKEAIEVFKKILNIVNLLENSNEKTTLLKKIIKVLESIGEKEEYIQVFQRVIELTNTLEAGYNKLSTLIEIAEALAKTKKKEESLNLFQKTLELVNTLKYPISKSNILIDLAESLNKIETKKEIFEIFEKATEIVNTLENEEIKLKTLKRFKEIRMR